MKGVMFCAFSAVDEIAVLKARDASLRLPASGLGARTSRLVGWDLTLSCMEDSRNSLGTETPY